MTQNATDDMFDAAAERVGRAFEASMLSKSSFHLSACGGCGAPSFKQPCMMCGFYPMGAPTAADMRPPAKREAFVQAVEASMPDGKGNLATWYLSSRRNTVAYEKSPAYRERVEAAVAAAGAIEGLPDPGAVFDFIKSGGRANRPMRDHDASRMWEAMFQLDMAVEEGQRGADHGGALGFVHKMAEEVEGAKRAAIAYMHSGEGDLGEVVEALSGAVDNFLEMRATYRWIPTGNLHAAKRDLDAVREGLPQDPTP